MIRSNWFRWAVLSGLLGIICAAYLITAERTTASGFPLDDAWIHQTYARNLGLLEEWSFQPGQPSAGSTAPGWTFWLAIGYRLGVDHFLWAFLSGFLTLLGIALIGNRILSNITGDQRRFSWLGIFLITEWHLVWAALSGMETIVFSMVILAVFWSLGKVKINTWAAGALIGLACWLRPDGITLLGPALLVLLFPRDFVTRKAVHGLRIMFGFLALFLPYLLLNYFLSGSFWPNTFFAKQAEYAVYLQVPFFERLITLLGLPIVGGGIVLLPGFLVACVRFIRTRQWLGIGAVLWWLGFTLIYAARLPVTYQHGRYLMPAMPVFWIIGWVGSKYLLESINNEGRRKLLRFAGGFGLGLVAGIFLLLGGKTYEEDVAIINSEMVETAKWVSSNTSKEDLIGAHDIGALGYFGEREIIDLAGLVSPDVIPFIRDETRLFEFMQEKEVKYLVTFPEWYPQMTEGLERVYQSTAPFSPLAGGENMAVFRLNQ